MFKKLNITESLDSPERTLHHREILLKKKFMRELYVEWYKYFEDSLKVIPEGKILEIGSGGGFLKDVLPQVITSDIIPLPTNDLTMSALEMPFSENELAAIFMIDTFHHLPDAEIFLKEVDRVLKRSGKVIMIEPANSLWGRFIYKNFHHEPFDPSGSWTFPSSGPLSGANGALPWIVFKRDRERFLKEFPRLRIVSMTYHTPLLYLISGGFTMPQLLPDFVYPFIRWVDGRLGCIQPLGMFTTIEIEKV